MMNAASHTAPGPRQPAGPAPAPPPGQPLNELDEELARQAEQAIQSAGDDTFDLEGEFLSQEEICRMMDGESVGEDIGLSAPTNAAAPPTAPSSPPLPPTARTEAHSAVAEAEDSLVDQASAAAPTEGTGQTVGGGDVTGPASPSGGEPPPSTAGSGDDLLAEILADQAGGASDVAEAASGASPADQTPQPAEQAPAATAVAAVAIGDAEELAGGPLPPAPASGPTAPVGPAAPPIVPPVAGPEPDVGEEQLLESASLPGSHLPGWQRAIVATATAIDRPWSSLSGRAKMILGIVGAVLILIGVTLWVMAPIELPRRAVGQPPAAHAEKSAQHR